MKLLVVEDEATAIAFLRRGLQEEGFAVDIAETGLQAENAILFSPYDLIVLDIMLPGKDGFTLCRAWREAGITTPILFLTARDDVRDRIQGLDRGGDDYLSKPFSFEELLARIRALLRRTRPANASAEVRIGRLRWDTNRREVSRDGVLIPLTVREYQILEFLAHQPGKVVTRTALWEHVWETGSEPDSNVVDVYIGYLRSKLGKDAIETIRGAGYLLHG